tara:strand:+ start:1433 stop:1711 length:279 start_codon:yes stop_codon:yes gene_type:complete
MESKEMNIKPHWKIVSFTDLKDFKFWAGAKELASKLTRQELEYIQEFLRYVYPDGMTETMVNDLFWFESDWICESIGLDVEKVLERKSVRFI